MTEETLFELALRTPEAERSALLDRACEGQPELRQRMEALLRADAASSSLLKTSTVLQLTPPSFDATTADYTQVDTPGTVIGPYKLLQKLGEGGMGTVWVAEQEQPVKRRVALKLVKAGMDSVQVLRRFEAERQALAMMDHTNIAKVFDAGTTTTGRPYFVMELVKGVPITKYCDEVHASIQDRLELFIQVCSAVQHAHQKGVIHRDIKPSNVLIAMQDDKPVPKVIDFGVAKALHTKLADQTMYTEIGQIIGTLEYMSPEQAELSAMDIDTRADIYALGVLLYELLTGGTPITRERMKSAAFVEVIRLIKEEEPQRPSTRLSESKATLASLAALRRTDPKKLSSTMRGELDWVVMKALEKDRTRRYETANGLARDIERYLADEVVEARPPSAGYRVMKFVRRNKGQVIAAGLILAVLVAGMIGTTLGLLEARAAKERESQRADGERKAKDQAEAEKKKAIEFRDKALDALRATTGEDVEKLIGAKPELSATERTYLEAIAKRWQVFARTEETDEQSRAIQAEGHFRVAYLWQQLGRAAEARREYEAARNLRKALADAFPAVLDYRHELARTYTNLGVLLADLGEREAARKEYATALGLRKALADAFPAVPEYRKDLATTHNNLGGLLDGLGEHDAARKEYASARELQKALADAFPAVPEYRKGLATTHHNLGLLLKNLGEREAARKECATALGLRKGLADAFPAVPAFRNDLAATHNNLGDLLAALGEHEAARKEYASARELQKALADAFPAVPAYRRELAATHDNLGILLIDLGKRTEAEEEFRRAMALEEKLVVDYPSVTKYGVDLGGSYCNFGILVRGNGKPADSLDWFAKAIRTLGPIYEQEPRAVTAKLFLRNSYWHRAKSLDQLQQYFEAVKDWTVAIKLSPAAELPYFRANRTTSQLHAGQVTEAVAEVAELTTPGANAARLAQWNGNQWYDFACVYAVASGKIADKKEEYAKRSLELLQQAFKAGYKDVAHMKKDTDLDPLRGREDFKKLMAELDKPAEKK